MVKTADHILVACDAHDAPAQQGLRFRLRHTEAIGKAAPLGRNAHLEAIDRHPRVTGKPLVHGLGKSVQAGQWPLTHRLVPQERQLRDRWRLSGVGHEQTWVDKGKLRQRHGVVHALAQGLAAQHIGGRRALFLGLVHHDLELLGVRARRQYQLFVGHDQPLFAAAPRRHPGPVRTLRQRIGEQLVACCKGVESVAYRIFWQTI
ncbi:MAG: hypothetical protein ACJ8GW_20055 [Massilia sp.]